jgi:hypothetical protein
LYLLGAICFRNNSKYKKSQVKIYFVAAIIAIPAVYVSILVGTSGGEIMKLEKLFKAVVQRKHLQEI